MQKQSENLHTNHINVDDKVESPKEKCEIRLLKEAPTSVMDISTKFVTDNRKAMLKKLKTYAEVLESSQGQNFSSSGENVINLEAIKKDLLNSENSSVISTLPPALCTNTSSPENSSAYKCNSLSLESTQDREFLDILEKLQKHEPCITDIRTASMRDERLQGHFCSDTVFNLSNRVLSENEIKVLEKGLDFAPTQRKIDEPELRKDFEEFCRRMRTKWNFRNEPS